MTADPDWDALGRRCEAIRKEAAAMDEVSLESIADALGNVTDQEVEALARVEQLRARMLPSPGISHGTGQLRRRTLLLVTHHDNLMRTLERRVRWRRLLKPWA